MSSDLFDLSSEVVVVIGGTGVLGGAMAQALAGAKVAVLGRNSEPGAAGPSKILLEISRMHPTDHCRAVG